MRTSQEQMPKTRGSSFGGPPGFAGDSCRANGQTPVKVRFRVSDLGLHFTYPFWRNHCAASARACLGGVCGSPSSRIALAGLKYILCLAMRTPASGAFGGWPVNHERASFAYAAPSATQ